MLFKDLRPVVGEQTKSNVIVEAGNDSVVSGELWLFSVDESIDSLEVKNIEPHDNILEITLTCSPATLEDVDWSATFNQSAIVSKSDDNVDTLIQD